MERAIASYITINIAYQTEPFPNEEQCFINLHKRVDRKRGWSYALTIQNIMFNYGVFLRLLCNMGSLNIHYYSSQIART